MKILIVGFGSIGRKHAEIIQRNNLADIYIAEPFQSSHAIASKIYGSNKVFHSIHDAFKANQSFDIAMVTTPTHLHITTAKELTQYNIKALFIEKKPIADSLDEIDELQKKLLNEKGIVSMVGCNMRFYPTISKIKEIVDNGEIGRPIFGTFRYGQYLPACRPDIDYKDSYSAYKEKKGGGGIILDDIHEIDLACYFFGSPSGFNVLGGKLSDLEMTAEDFASINIRYESGTVAHILMDYIHPLYRRSLEIVGTDGAVRWNEDHNKVLISKHGNIDWAVSFELQGYDYYDIYSKQMEYMINCLQGGLVPMNSIDQAKQVLSLALDIRYQVYQQMTQQGEPNKT